MAAPAEGYNDPPVVGGQDTNCFLTLKEVVDTKFHATFWSRMGSKNPESFQCFWEKLSSNTKSQFGHLKNAHPGGDKWGAQEGVAVIPRSFSLPSIPANLSPPKLSPQGGIQQGCSNSRPPEYRTNNFGYSDAPVEYQTNSYIGKFFSRKT